MLLSTHRKTWSQINFTIRMNLESLSLVVSCSTELSHNSRERGLGGNRFAECMHAMRNENNPTLSLTPPDVTSELFLSLCHAVNN